jgi:hypothetical protein
MNPAIIKYQYGKGTNYYISIHSDYFLKRLNSVHSVIREFIRENSGWGMADFDLKNTMILRMDDPGTCERVYLKGYDTKVVGRDVWEESIALLKKYHARLSVMYIPLWIDDGNSENGDLFVNGREVRERKRGRLYDSKDIIFVKNHGKNEKIIYDYSEEFLALTDGLRSGLVDIESHGLTHVDTKLDRWLQAKDRYSNPDWYHEFRHVYDNRDSDEAEQTQVLQKSAQKIKEFFGISPCTIAPSGHEQSSNSEEISHMNGYKLFSSNYNSIVKQGLIIRNTKIKSIFFEETKPDSSFLNSGYPIVGVFHDFDIVNKGVNWLEDTIADWKKHGTERFITLREFVGYLCSSIKAFQDKNKMHVEVDVSRTGDISDKLESRFFSANRMFIDIALPKGKKPENIIVDGDLCREFEYSTSNNRIKLPLPPFKRKDRQEVIISLT